MDVRGAGSGAPIVDGAWGRPAGVSDGRFNEAPLAALVASPLNKRFCAWHGASGRRYLTTVFAVDTAADDAGLPPFESCLLVAVTRGAAGRRIVAISLIERPGDRRPAMAAALARGAVEWHVHLLSSDQRARASAAADLRARHIGEEPAARCA